MAFVGCSKSSDTDGTPDPNVLRACGGTTPAPATEVPPQHRSTAQACSPTPASANVGWGTYDATGRACTKDDECTADAGLPGHCLQGACTIDECLTDDDCAGGGVCVCSSGPNSAVVSRNACVAGNCRVDADCGANGFCIPSAGTCAVTGYYCHTAADTCVDPALDCGSPCLSACAYFSDKKAFSCVAPMAGGC